MSAEPLLEIGDLHVTYWRRAGLLMRREPFHAVKGATLSLKPGETLGLVGESGSGKSSIANAVLGLVPAASGSIRFGGVELSEMKTHYPPAVRKQIQAVFQDPFSSLNPSMTVEEIVTEPLKVHTKMTRAERRARAVELLELVSLTEEHLSRHPHQFSGGQRQRIAIARALICRPKLVVADEPVSALDLSVQAQVLELIRELRDSHGIAFLFISHSLAVVESISDDIGVMHRGRFVETGKARDVFRAPRDAYTRQLIDAEPRINQPRRYGLAVPAKP